MADIDLKTETPDTSLPTTGFLFGADSQAAASPSVFTVQSVATTLLGSSTLTGATVTTSSPVIDAAQTWNDGAVTFTGLRFNAEGSSGTNSAAASLLMDLQVGGSERFAIRKDGAVRVKNAGISFENAGAYNLGIARIETNILSIGLAATTRNGLAVTSTSSFGFEVSSTIDTFLTRRAAANLRFGAADAAAPVAQTLSAQSVAAGTTNTAGANLTITGSQGTGTGAGGSIIFQVAPAGSSGTAQNALVDTITIAPNGNVTFPRTGAAQVRADGEGFTALSSGTARAGFSQFGCRLTSGLALSWSDSTSSPNSVIDTILLRDAANTLALRNGANAQAFRVYNTFTSATNFERGNIFWDSNVLKIGTEKGSAGGTARALEFQTDGTTRLTIGTTGAANFTSSIQSTGVAVTSSAYIYWLTRSTMSSAADGRILLANNAVTDFDRLQFGGTTSSFPAIKRSSTTLQARLADDSAFASVQGKLTTETAYTAGAPTATGYLVLYDSNGTAYKVPAEAL